VLPVLYKKPNSADEVNAGSALAASSANAVYDINGIRHKVDSAILRFMVFPCKFYLVFFVLYFEIITVVYLMLYKGASLKTID
jgi:hypothetical protein